MDEKSNIKIDNRITPYKKRINTIDDELESEKAKLKKIKLGLLSLMSLHMVLATLMLLNQLPRILVHQQLQ